MAPAPTSENPVPVEALPDPKPTTDFGSPLNFSLEGKTIAITGGARGLGLTLAYAVVEAGGCAACLDILDAPSPPEWAELQKLAKTSGRAVSYRKCDVTEERAMETAYDLIAEEAENEWKAPFWGTIACAGIQQQVPALEYPAGDFDRILRVNVTGVFNTCKYAARRLLKQGAKKGSIVIISSMSGNVANRGLTCTAYNSSKAAVQQMCRSVAQEWGQYGIRVNTLSPGYIRTAMTDQLLIENPAVEETWMRGALLGRLGTPGDFKAPAVFLLSEGSEFVHGIDLRVDGGHTASA